MKKIFFFIVFLASHIVFAEQITIGGTVSDSASLVPIDSILVEIINKENFSERYSIYTNSLGKWSYTFQSNSVGSDNAIPNSFSLNQNYPNPFNPSTQISFSVHQSGSATLSVYNTLGQLLDSKTYEVNAGEYSVRWTSVGAAGALFYSLRFGNSVVTKKMIQLDGGNGGGLGDAVLTRGIVGTSTLNKILSNNYLIRVSKLGYEPDSVSISLSNNSNINFSLSTVHSRAFVIDLHNDIMELAVEGYQIGIRHTTNQSDLPRFRDGGVDAQMISLWSSPTDFPTTSYQRVLQMADTFKVQSERYSSMVAQARTFSEIQSVVSAGKFAGIFGVEGGHSINDTLQYLINLYNLGARYLTITWNNSTSWAVSAADAQSTTKGLSDFGKQVITTMDSLGMLIDVSHTGIKTIEDILTVTKNPIIASHSGCRALRNHTRNLTDDQIKAIAKSGGVIGVVFYTSFISSAAANKVTVDTVIAHIDYIKNLVGIDYIAIGADYDGGITAPVGLENVSKMPNLTLALLKRGYSSADVKKILGGNFMRVFKAVCK